MGELLPGRQAMRVRDGLLDYLTTTFALADSDARDALTRLLEHPETGMFKGPYLRTGMPFAPAPRREARPLDWLPAGFTPYAHQAEAFRRLSSLKQRPQPTLVTTGTGSGKTEAFLLPILDHCLRARRSGQHGIKALILYPMNALANDQAARLARLISRPDADGNQPLADITAALYTGEDGPQRTTITEDGLITDRHTIRDDPPDVLLTNYKMLDQLLLRAEDQTLWRDSAVSLTYLVLDEFHTYDGAQGTDVAMLLRRLGMALRTHHPDADWTRPLGDITPVGTSATLGSGEKEQNTILSFATEIFGERFDHTCLVGERRLTVEDWAHDAPNLAPRRLDAEGITTLAAQLHDDLTPHDLTAIVLNALFDAQPPMPWTQAVKTHLDILDFLTRTARATHLDELADALPGGPDTLEARRSVTLALHGALGHLRATGDDGTGQRFEPDRSMPSTEVHMWVRELSRIDRFATAAAQFRWSDDGAVDSDDATSTTAITFPAVHCRLCGQSGWGVQLAPTGLSLASDDTAIRRDHLTKEGRFRALLYAPGDNQLDGGENIGWFDPEERHLSPQVGPQDENRVRDGRLLRVITHWGDDADDDSRRDRCPSCGQPDAIRFVGSAVATLLSVSLSTLFGSPSLDDREKKALIFTDSVQDAAHRAGFVQSRSHSMTLRSVLADACDQPRSLPDLVDRALDQARTQHQRVRLLPPSLTDRQDVAPWYAEGPPPPKIRDFVRRRLLFDAELEFGLVSNFGRTLERTGALSVTVTVDDPTLIAACRAAVTDVLIHPEERALRAWATGFLERMRTQGAIAHEWLERYITHDGALYHLWGGRRRDQGMPAFPKGRSRPALPRIGGARLDNSGLDAVTSPQSWYTVWTAKVLGITRSEARGLATSLFRELARHQIVTSATTQTKATVHALDPASITISPTEPDDLAAGRHALRCDLCQAQFPVGVTTGEHLDGQPCLHASCSGRLCPHPIDATNYYRQLYTSSHARRIVAKEHTSLLPTEERLAHENGFKHSAEDPVAPNVLVATPTLEMGIDIGDLSSVFLSSLPRTVANYIQRVGRAGRLTGNAMDLAFVEGRGEFLPRLGEPTSLINGTVEPPATYLSAEEILRRQYLAHIADELARDARAAHPRRVHQALAEPSPRSFLGQMIARAHTDSSARLDRFLAAFTVEGTSLLRDDAAERLRRWATPTEGNSPLAETIARAADRWRDTQQRLREQVKRINERLPDLESRANDSDDGKRSLKEALAELKQINMQLADNNGYWIAELERLGLLPNYSLIDDSVELNVTFSWVDPDTGEFRSEPADYQRASARALSEFAPGSTFYASGRRIAIDGVAVGPAGSDILDVWLCPSCGHIAEHGAISVCPRCRGAGISDLGQRFRAIELTKVSAHVRRDDAAIDDQSDQRARVGHTIVTAADLDEASVQSRWFTSSDLAVTHLRDLSIQWLNLGPRRHTSEQVEVAGWSVRAPLFRICEACGQLDRAGNSNSADEHRPWCPHRHSPEEHSVKVLLRRRLVTEGILISLPQAVALDPDHFAAPSLMASLLLGLRKAFGGAPDHLSVATVHDPSSENRTALLLHDNVPGGTGYLAELANHQQLHTVLSRALQALEECPCAEEGRLACHRCLLPHSPPQDLALISRRTAVRHLRTMLGIDTDTTVEQTPAWMVTTEAPTGDDSGESHLELQFRRQFQDLVVDLGGTITQRPGRFGNTILAHFATRGYRLEPQVQLDGVRPDFVLSSEGIPEVAIFTDGWQYHASPAHNRIADDAEKRERLRQQGYLVLAVTAADLAGTPRVPVWFDETMAAKLGRFQSLQHTEAARQALTRGPLEFLRMWLFQPDVDNLRRFGRVVPATLQLLSPLPEQPLHVSTTAPTPEKATMTATLDDRTDLTTDQAKQAWADWLWLQNATIMLDPTVARFDAASETNLEVAAPEASSNRPLSTGWQEVVDELEPDPEALAVIQRLDELEVEPPSIDDIGQEIGDNWTPMDLVWPAQRLAVTLSGGIPELTGWSLLGPDPDQIAATWRSSHA
ncbi:MAG: DEAD/DEAH box helicase [Propionibacteriaceae bacterium]|nr:DEAD/DEAH box helicase [Propionibacteriaceae bacterium]